MVCTIECIAVAKRQKRTNIINFARMKKQILLLRELRERKENIQTLCHRNMNKRSQSIEV